ncbi:DUF1295 domain-containing protein [Streptomyces roseoverticillatus]|uniref:DUF1295 domain-containing protein n=1 Tax=Streptomyces roseoverticillatus TaxID=66429 RepID=UPI0033D70565
MTASAWYGLGVNLAATTATVLAVLLVTVAVALPKGLHRLVDIAWGIAFTAVATVTCLLSAGRGDGTQRILVTAATAVWGLRLAAHLAWRGRGGGEDPRYERLLARAPGNRNLYALRTVYLPQAALIWLVSLPVQVAQYEKPPATNVTLLGLILWAAGLAFEAVGDFQLARFTSDTANRGRILDRGLWAVTRHPNYFGDFLVWWGLYLTACGSWQSAALCLLSPMVMTYLLTRGSGKRLLEAHMAARPGYTEYVTLVSGFVPLPARRKTLSDAEEGRRP